VAAPAAGASTDVWRGACRTGIPVNAARLSVVELCGVDVLCPTSAVVVRVKGDPAGGGRFGQRSDCVASCGADEAAWTGTDWGAAWGAAWGTGGGVAATAVGGEDTGAGSPFDTAVDAGAVEVGGKPVGEIAPGADACPVSLEYRALSRSAIKPSRICCRSAAEVLGVGRSGTVERFGYS
jgi:hypothetical protein